MPTFVINVPATSANIGPGFDVMGLSLSLYLTVTAQVNASATAVTIAYEGANSDGLSCDPKSNLITSTASYVLQCNGIRSLPSCSLLINNRIPLGRGLGSSGAAVVAGVLLANSLGSLNLSRQRMLDYCLMIEHHPDNVAAALVGGFVASYLIEVDRSGDIPASEAPRATLDEQRKRELRALAADASLTLPPENIGHFVQLECSSAIRAVAVIPQFELATSKARAALPSTYETRDVVFNLQRLAVLTTALGRKCPDPWLIFRAMEDRVHQPYRMHLVPGLPEILASFNPDNTPGLLGICLSGAGPTILALAVSDFDAIAKKLQAVLARHDVDSKYQVLDIVSEGASCETQ
ncbi:Trihydroxynaphthalene reductase [Coemansia sp. RSA 1972]|nr:Trihydroxynaphthalene reductase [Coemansia sp. RSA 1972]